MACTLYWLAPVSWMIFIFAKSGDPSVRISTTNAWLAHMAEYGVLTFLLTLAAAKTTRWDWRVLLVAITVFGAVYGATDELHQMFVPGRSASLVDWLTDVFGVLGVTLAMDERFFKRPAGPQPTTGGAEGPTGPPGPVG